VIGPAGARGRLARLPAKTATNNEHESARARTVRNQTPNAKVNPYKLNLATTVHAHLSVLGPAGARGRNATPIATKLANLNDLELAGALMTQIPAKATQKRVNLATEKSVRSSASGLAGAVGASARLLVARTEAQRCILENENARVLKVK
jgi:hypothetical protein